MPTLSMHSTSTATARLRWGSGAAPSGRTAASNTASPAFSRPSPLYFFDSASHPLGSKDLSLKDAPWRKLIKPIKIGKAA